MDEPSSTAGRAKRATAGMHASLKARLEQEAPSIAGRFRREEEGLRGVGREETRSAGLATDERRRVLDAPSRGAGEAGALGELQG